LTRIGKESDQFSHSFRLWSASFDDKVDNRLRERLIFAAQEVEMSAKELAIFVRAFGEVHEESQRKNLLYLLVQMAMAAKGWTEMFLSLTPYGHRSGDDPEQLHEDFSGLRSVSMYLAAFEAAEGGGGKGGVAGVWKIGENHLRHMGVFVDKHTSSTPMHEFDTEFERWQKSRRPDASSDQA
jgi:hypothetical protein